MNIFILHYNPKICAQLHCDKHVVKMILETAQLLYTCLWVMGLEYGCMDNVINDAPLTQKGTKGYRATHKKHPCALWLCESVGNYEWLCTMGKELCREYTYRYGKIHSTEVHIDWLTTHCPNITEIKMTKFKQAMPDIYKNNDPITAYKSYYNGEKSFAKWTKRPIPKWFKLN